MASFTMTFRQIRSAPTVRCFNFRLESYKLWPSTWQYLELDSPGCYPSNFTDNVHKQVRTWLEQRYDPIDFTTHIAMRTTMKITVRTVGQARRLRRALKQLIVLEQLNYPYLLLTDS